MENVASFLQYGGSPMLGGISAQYNEVKAYQPTPEEIEAEQKAKKKHRAKDAALVVISTAEKLLALGLDVDAAFETASKFFEKSKAYLAKAIEE
jgi:hypothetical protein